MSKFSGFYSLLLPVDKFISCIIFSVCNILANEKREHSQLKETWQMANDQFLESQRLMMMDMRRMEGLLSAEQQRQLTGETQFVISLEFRNEYIQRKFGKRPVSAESQRLMMMDMRPMEGLLSAEQQRQLTGKTQFVISLEFRNEYIQRKFGKRPVSIELQRLMMMDMRPMEGLLSAEQQRQLTGETQFVIFWNSGMNTFKENLANDQFL